MQPLTKQAFLSPVEPHFNQLPPSIPRASFLPRSSSSFEKVSKVIAERYLRYERGVKEADRLIQMLSRALLVLGFEEKSFSYLEDSSLESRLVEKIQEEWSEKGLFRLSVEDLLDLKILSHEHESALREKLKKDCALVEEHMLASKDRSGKVRSLDLEDQGLLLLPSKWDKKWLDLRILNLSANQLIDLPSWIGDLENLLDLDLSDNRLKELPKEIGKLKQILTLKLQRNEIKSLPEEVGELTSLLSLCLEGNELTQLPLQIDQLRELCYLDLRGNKFSEVPDCIQNFANLFVLDLSGNLITKLPEWIKELKQLLLLKVNEHLVGEDCSPSKIEKDGIFIIDFL